MGSSGTGSFGDLKGSSESQMCLRSIKDDWLEEVARCDFFKTQGGVPSIMHPVHIHNSIVNGRIVVVSTSTDEIIGLLPSSYSYLLGCMKKGHQYIGTVVHSVNTPIPKVMVNIDAV
ncbi:MULTISPECIES: hypothetical protein [Paenibacillus]|uniref:hypothetical protein n=1 Tax=Paenibacillus TaxID=44249 RepID=UPI00096C4FB1|nr:hypothetical protein [Paenibacillus odorifer]OMD77810.1 hypothetical protein BSK50_11240 [Paenibacillus odorifer]OMD82741.1 hypothetical protein BSK53_16100 [Paenibacillus odorifer]